MLTFDKRDMLRTTGPGTHFKLALTSDTFEIDCRVLLWAEKLGAGLWAGLLSWNCQLEITAMCQALFETSQFREES